MWFLSEVGIALVVGAVTGVAVAVISGIRTLHLNRKLAAEFPVSGEYLTVFDDDDCGTLKRHKERLVLSQEGSRFSGHSDGLHNSRRYRFEGNIMVEQRFLTGAYFDADPTLRGVGTFFMEPDGSGGYEGIWAGFGGDQGEIVSGRYSWRPAVDVAVRPIRQHEVDPLVLQRMTALLGEGLGARYVSLDDLSAKLDSTIPEDAVFVAEVDGTIVGVATTGPVDREFQLSLAQKLSKVGVAPLPFDYHRCGYLQSSAVARSYRRQGIGAQLARARVNHLTSVGCTSALGVSWLSGSTDNSQGVLTQAGLEQVAIIPDYWAGDSVDYGYSCPNCGNPCRCSAAVYFGAL